MKRALFVFLAALLIGLGAGQAMAQEDSSDPLSKMIWNMFQMRQGKTLCLVEATPLAAVRANVAAHLRAMGVTTDPNPQVVAKALWTLYPCPFSPFRPELRPATAADIEGAWLFPHSSQKMYSGLSTHRRSPSVECDVLAYHHGGELRHLVVREQARCPFETADDLDSTALRAPPANWSLLHDGRIRVTWQEMGDTPEEWDVFAVFTPFEVDGVKFRTGDLVTYGRRGKGNEVNAATHFRHLQRLP